MLDEISVILDEEDFIAAYRVPLKRRRASLLVLVLAMMIALLITALLIRFPEARLAFIQSPLIAALSGAVVLAATLVLLLLVSAPALRRRAARSTLDDHPGMRDPVQYTFDPEHFAARSTYSQARYPWAQLWDWRECDRVVIIFPTPRNFYVIPKRAVDPEAMARLRSYLVQVRRRASAS